MSDNLRRLILVNGEKYSEPITKSGSGRQPDPPRTYEDARDRIKADIKKTLDLLDEIPQKKRLPEEVVFCLRMHPDAIAKSYFPTALTEAIPGLRDVGSRMYLAETSSVAPTKNTQKAIAEGKANIHGRLVFLQGVPHGVMALRKQLDRAESEQTKDFRKQIQRIEKFDLLDANEQITGFDEQWVEGRVELVLHPSKTSSKRQKEFLFELLDIADIDLKRSTIRSYSNGPTFVSCWANRTSLDTLAGTNPLRSIHPLRFGGIENLRNAPIAPAPTLMKMAPSECKVGMFDGGVDLNVPLLNGHVVQDEDLSIKTHPDPEYIQHGTAVAGALLHGALNGTDQRTQLDKPPISVVSFRALPTSDPSDIDLYESIDIVENAVPKRPDIKVYNLSFGPRGPIEDDSISRFTFVLDQLAYTYKVTFFVAVGNDGEIEGENRIQSPSDLVNGAGVAAHDLNRKHVKYSCIGPGRDSAKIKPDFAAFGGCENHPFHLVSTDGVSKNLAWGTSFATPLASRMGAQASYAFNESSALLGRALLLHASTHPDKKPNQFLGYGCIPQKMDDLLLCDPKSVTVISQSQIVPTKSIKLPLPWVASDVDISGMIDIRWTVCALVPVTPLHPSDYASVCLEDTFYPHDRRYNFSIEDSSNGKTQSKKLHLDLDASEIENLLTKGWKQAGVPATKSGKNTYKNEVELRNTELKWETIIRRDLRMKAKSLENPFLTIKATGRHQTKDAFEYAVVATMTAKKFEGDLYEKIRKRFAALTPIRLRQKMETQIRIK